MKYDTLESIFRMMAPIDMFGALKNVLSQNQSDVNGDFVSSIMSTILDLKGNGAVESEQLKLKLLQLAGGNNDENKKQFYRLIRYYCTTGGVFENNKFDWHLKLDDGTQVGSFDSLIGLDENNIKQRGKTMAIVLNSSNFITPAVKSASEAGIFLNYMPSHIMSRCVPYLSAEFVIDNSTSYVGKGQPTGMLKFLMGSQEKLSGPDKLMFEAGLVEKTNSVASVMGMEMFTSPQTLVNLNGVANGSRYVNVLDPFRPFASIQSLTVNVAPTVGAYSFKTANLVLKLHDRSRLSELAAFIQPLTYSKTTLWLTWGWRHPNEKDNPYADFINRNMMLREPYGISNSQYSFEQSGEVTVTLQLFTKGVRELSEMRLSQLSQSFNDIYKQIQSLADSIGELRRQLNLEKPEGINKEIRTFQVLESAERGEFPNIKIKDIQKAINSLRNSLNSQSVDKDAANKLINDLSKLYEGDDSKKIKFSFQESIESRTDEFIKSLFDAVTKGPDPFLVTTERDKKRMEQLGIEKHPFAKLADDYNKSFQKKDVQAGSLKLGRRLVSFGKLFSTFVCRAAMTVPGIDDIQLFYYNFNDRAASAAGMNIAEFPIDIAIFLDQFREHVSKQRSDNLSLQEFLKLIIDAQLGDMRGVGYGFYSYFQPYDPKKREATMVQNLNEKKNDEFESKVGPFKKPTIEVYIETMYVNNEGKKEDLLKSFEQASKFDLKRIKSDLYKKVLRIHVYDRQVDPYPMTTSMLFGDNAPIQDKITSNAKVDAIANKNSIAKKSIDNSLPKQHAENIKLNSTSVGPQIIFDQIISNDRIKKFVALTMPSIIYGANGSSVSTINVTTKQDPNLSAVQMMANAAGRPATNQPNGGGTGGLPLRVIPASVTINSMGCPLINYMQLFFIDFNTGTTIDNVYGVTGMTHTITPGKFESSMTMTWYDAYGKYESKQDVLKTIAKMKLP